MMIKPRFPALQADSLLSETQGKPPPTYKYKPKSNLMVILLIISEL